MKDVCGMCGEREAEQELCRTENHNDCWAVCWDCAQSMLNDPTIAWMWQTADQQRVAQAHGRSRSVWLSISQRSWVRALR